MIASKLKKIASFPRRYTWYIQQWRAFKAAEAQESDQRFPPAKASERVKSLWEATSTTAFDAHYLYHVAWAVRAITRLAPAVHVDISSSLYFSATLSATVPTQFYDFRSTPLDLDNLDCGQADLTQLPFENGTLESLSCMHTIEHVGLGRYGDPIDVNGDLRAAKELSRVVAPGGTLLMVVPVGMQKIEFNTHRIYSRNKLLEMFPDFEPVETALVRDDRRFVLNPPDEAFDDQRYGCGCFLLRKLG